MEKVWLKRYPADMPEFIDPDHYGSLLDIFEQTVHRFADQPAFMNMGTVLTYRALEEKSRAFAAYLQHELGMVAGERVAIMMPNLLQYPIALFGALRAGMVVVNVNPLYTPRELKHQLCDADVKTIVIISNFAYTLEKVVDDTPVEHVILTKIGDMLPGPKRPLVNFVVRYIKRMVPKYDLPGASSFRKALANGRHCQYIKPDITGDNIAFLQYTGGTTGLAKGAMLTHRNMVANLEQACGVLGPLFEYGKECIVTPLPLYHIFSLTVNCLLFMKLGARNLLITNPRDIPGFIKELSKTHFTAITGVNTLFNALVNDEEFSKLDFSNLVAGVGGGMAVQQKVAEQWQAITGNRLMEGYGLTECSPAVCFNPYDLDHFNGSIGLPMPSTEVRVIDEDGKELGIGEVGELQVRGPQVMKGYWRRPDDTKKTIDAEGWLKTGDIAKYDDDGFFYIVDRKKDMILVSGFNVFPNEIEDVVVLHPLVLECAAIGVPNDASGEKVKIFVVRKDDSLTEDELHKHCRMHLTAYKVPKLIEFRDELPKSNVGKILRRELREEELKK